MKEKEIEIAQYHLHKEHPEKLQFEIYDLKAYLERSCKHAQVAHSHSFYQILWIFNEGGTHYIDFDAHPVKENSLFFISKNQIHYFDAEASHEGILIHFNENFLMQSDVDIFLKYNVFTKKDKSCHCISGDLIVAAKAFIELIKRELENKTDFGHAQIVRYLLKSLLIVMERTQHENNGNDIRLTSQYELQYLQFRELIESHYDKAYTVSQYAGLLHISRKTLTTITKNIVAKSPSELIAERIVLEAKRLLSFTPLKVNEIAYKLGFEDPSYFVKYFKRHLNLSPIDYRALSTQ